MPTVTPGIYQHFKGGRYRVIGVSRHSETETPLVVYQALYGDFGLWVRPLDSFDSSVEIDGQVVPRFKWLQSLESEDWSALAVSLSASSNSEV